MAGVLDQKSVVSAIGSLAGKADFQPGDRVKTLKGSVRGKIMRILEDGRVVWRADTGAELTGLPESLIREKNK